MNKRKLVSLICVIFLFSFNFFPVLAWEPGIAKAHTSEEEWFISFQLGYGNLVDQPVFIPFDSQIIPTPEVGVIMMGVERNGERNVTFLTYNYNTTSHEWDNLYKNESYSVRLDSNKRYGRTDVTLEVDPNATKMLVVFNYLDIWVEFWFEPDPLYLYREQTELQVRIRGLMMVGAAIVVFILSLIAGRRLQRRAVVVPKLPIISGVMFIIGVALFISALVLIRYAYTGLDLLIRGFLSYDWLLLYPTQFGVFTLWIAYRHMGDVLQELQIDYSRFDPLEKFQHKKPPTVTEGTKEEEKPRHQRSYLWTKDIAIYECYRHKRKLCWVRNKNSWAGFAHRILGHHEYIADSYIQSIKPDSGYWVESDKRVFISALRVNDKKGGVDIEVSLRWDDVVVSGVGLGLFILGVGGVIKGWPALALMGIGVIILIVGYLAKRSVIKIVRTPSILEIEPNRFIEGEMILYQQLDLTKFQDQIMLLQKQVVDKTREAIEQGYKWVIFYVEVFEELLKGTPREEEPKESPKEKEESEDESSKV